MISVIYIYGVDRWVCLVWLLVQTQNAFLGDQSTALVQTEIS